MSRRTCPYCRGMLVKYGFLKKEHTQRYKCKSCKKHCSDVHSRPFGTLRTDPDKILLVIKLLAEGSGIRSSGRIAKCHRDTVLRILRHAGERSFDLLNKKLVDVPVNHVEADEIHTFVLRKDRANTEPDQDTNPWGDFYIFLGLESETKLLLMPTIGKRSELSTEQFAGDMRRSTTGRFQLTTDGFRPYKRCMTEAMGDRIDFAQFYKEYNMLAANRNGTVNTQYKDSAHKFLIRCGEPDQKRITTSHVERVNLSLRIENKRFNRRTICFSKSEEYLACSVYLFVAHYNFVRPHSALGKKTTPAMKNGLEQKPWSLTELLGKRAINAE